MSAERIMMMNRFTGVNKEDYVEKRKKRIGCVERKTVK
jgi:hypothetical protein